MRFEHIKHVKSKRTAENFKTICPPFIVLTYEHITRVKYACTMRHPCSLRLSWLWILMIRIRCLNDICIMCMVFNLTYIIIMYIFIVPHRPPAWPFSKLVVKKIDVWRSTILLLLSWWSFSYRRVDCISFVSQQDQNVKLFETLIYIW
jgi:hypothetical protein